MDVVCTAFDRDKCKIRIQDIRMCSADGFPYRRGMIASVIMSLRGLTHGMLHGTLARCRIGDGDMEGARSEMRG